MCFGYDAAGNQTRTLNALGCATYFGFDALNQWEKSLDALSGAFVCVGWFQYKRQGLGETLKGWLE